NNEQEIDSEWLSGVQTIGLTAGASTPEDVVQAVILRLRAYGVRDVEDVEFVREDIVFGLPKAVLSTG
ncbi:MAG: 4-hydroxy-3-methylbut-2-enyl diphosphate reductase, partial [Chlamydiia bacterium]|nr:4-hydroxy-3-methylbut-2-enyl diphosphate reductase [Chlamydiia bacterium]